MWFVRLGAEDCVLQPGVADAGIEQLVEDKVDLFWRGMESGAANKKGKV